MKIYIAGKITGDRNYKERFACVKDRLEAMGHIVLNPAELPERMTPRDYMRICFAMIDCAEAVVLMRGWGESKGARIESDYAEYVGKKLFVEAPDRFMDAYKPTEYLWEA